MQFYIHLCLIRILLLSLLCESRPKNAENKLEKEITGRQNELDACIFATRCLTPRSHFVSKLHSLIDSVND